MKVLRIFVIYQLSAVVKGTFFANAARGIAQPIILSVGTMFAAISLDKHSIRDLSLFKSENNEEKKEEDV